MKQRIPNQIVYLLGNLVILCLLLIGLLRGQPIWDTSIRLPNLLLILVILNTVMIFREGWPDRPAIYSKVAHYRLFGRDLARLRRFLADSGLSDDCLPAGALELLLTETGATGLMLLYFAENGIGSQLAATGSIPPQLSGIRWSLRKGDLVLRHPGNLGEEVIPGWEGALAPRHFRSGITVLVLTLIPLRLVGGRVGMLASVGGFRRTVESRFGVGSSANSLRPEEVAMFLEAVLDLHFTRIQAGEGKFLDPQTGLLRYENFHDSLDTEIERSERYNQSMTLLMLSLVPFEEFPDTVKENYAKAVAAALRASLRRLDIMFRGKQPGEFAAILTETNTEIARLVAGRVMNAFQKQIQSKKEIFSEDCARLYIGYATYPGDATHASGLLEKAEEALSMARARDVSILAFASLHEAEAGSASESPRENA